MFYLELVSGLRKGELVALRWDDLDVQSKTISVSRQYVRNPDGSLELTRPKTENSVRLVSIPQAAVDLLLQEHDHHPDNPYMFPSPLAGEMYHPDSVVNLHKKILKDAGLEHLKMCIRDSSRPAQEKCSAMDWWNWIFSVFFSFLTQVASL